MKKKRTIDADSVVLPLEQRHVFNVLEANVQGKDDCLGTGM
jgi:hypothetical protein